MKKLRKVFLLAIALLFVVSLAACKNKTARNTSVPLGSLSTDTVVAQSGDYKITNAIYYDQLRSSGYDTVLNNIKKKLFKKELDEVKAQINFGDNQVTDYEQELFDAYAVDVYQSSEADNLKSLDEKKLNQNIQKYIDSAALKNIKVTAEDLKLTLVNDKVYFKTIPNEIVEEKLLQIAIDKATKDELLIIVDNEKIEDEDGKKVTNSNYISEEDVINSYNSTQKTYGTYKAIIIQFNTLFEAENYYNRVVNQVGPLTDENALYFYKVLYNYYYNYRTPLTETPFDGTAANNRTTFVVNEDQDDLSDVSASVKTILLETLEKDHQYISYPFNQDNKYVMIYKGDTVYDVNKKYNITPLNESLEWEDLKAKNETAANEVYAEAKDKLVESKVSSYSSTVINKRIKAANIKIYDPFFEFKFNSSYEDDYELIKPSDFKSDAIFELQYNDSVETYTVEDFYKECTASIGVKTLVNLVELEYVYQFKDKFLDSDDIDEMTSSINDALTAFNKNENSAYPSEIGESTYLLANYGYSNKDNAIKYNKVAASVLSSYLNQTVFDEWAKVNEDGTYPENHAIDFDKLNILENILEKGNANYKNLFSINIDHLLIYIDDDGDGNPDDPKDFFEKNSEVDKEQFKQAILNLAKAIYREANCEQLTKSNTLMEILNYIVSAYNKNEKLFSEDHDWSEYKKYNFQLKVESLSSNGDTTQSNVTNYVEEFADYVRALYKKADENKLDTDNGDKPTFYFIESAGKEPEKFEDICSTQFGYHMIVVNDYEQPSTTEKKASSDQQYGYQKNIEILLNENDSDNTKDNIYVIVENTYNEETKNAANMNQFFTYYVQSQKGYSSSLDSTMRDLLSSMFSSSITRYTSKAFQDYLLFNRINMTISDSTYADALAAYKTYLKNVSQEYNVDDDFEAWYADSMNWNRPY